MSERKVLNKYFPPDFDPSKIKRSKIPRDTQMVIRLMAPFSMRCTRCGEYIYKGKKFNARKETAVGEDYFGIKIFRFYIKCPTCSSEITFKTDPKAADYTMEHGAKRNFENWADSDPTGKVGFIPDAAADDDLDSNGDVKESAASRDAMADLERSQEASRLEMERMDELSDLRQRNARVEQGLGTDPSAILEALHAERETAEEEEKRRREEEEDDLLVRQVFSKVPTMTSGIVNQKGKGKGKAKVMEDGEEGQSDEEDDDDEVSTPLPEALTIKRKIAPGSGGAGEPSVQSLLAAKGKVLDGSATVASSNGSALPGQIKRKREGMQKLLGIKKKVKA